MSALIFFLGGVVLSVIVSLVTIAVIKKSFREILIELCGTASRAEYWLKASEACLVLIAVFPALIFQNYPVTQQAANITLFWCFVRQVAFTLAAIFTSLIVISVVLLRSLPNHGKAN